MIKPEDLKIFGEKVLIELDAQVETVKNGLIIPESEAEGKVRNTGMIVLLGPDADETLKIGDRVMFNEYEMDKVVFEDAEYALVDSDYIYAILN